MSTKVPARAIAHWQQVCRSHARTANIKRADISGGDGQGFEASMSNLAHAYLRDRAPQLLDYELGFQLLEKNEDNDRAIGIFGFKVGNQLMYAPVFFLNGELKGHELLYLKDSDTFIPMKENWVNYVLNRKPNVVGEEVMPQLGRLGVDRPNMDQFRLSPSRTHKFGSAHPAWLNVGLPGLMSALGNPVRLPLQVPALVKSSASMAMRFLQTLERFPQLTRPIVECYGPQVVHDAIGTAKTANSVMPIEPELPAKRIVTGSVFKEPAVKRANVKLQIWAYDGTAECAAGLNADETEKLARDGVLIKDAREETSKAYKIDKHVALQNPDSTGHYEVLCQPDKFEKCLYINAPYGARGTRPNAVLVRLGDGDSKAWTETHSGSIFVNEKYSDKEYASWLEGLPSAENLEQGSIYVLLSPNGRGTCTFEVEATRPSGENDKAYKVWWRGGYASRRPDHLPRIGERRYEHDDDGSGEDLVVIGAIKGSKFLSRGSTLYAPAGTKALKLKSKSDSCCSPCCSANESSDPPALRPGNMVDIQIGLLKASSELKVFNNGTEAIVDGRRMAPRAALVSLVRDYGLREKAAKDLLAEAQLKRGVKCRIKYAEPYGTPYAMLGSPPSAPPFPPEQYMQDSVMGSGIPTIVGQEQEIPVTQMRTYPTRPNYATPPEPIMAQQLQEAARTGQKEVLDASVLSNLLRGSQNETLIDKHLPALVKGLDSLGRLLFNLYWHYDKFEDRYGGKTLPDLEDAMRNSFDTLGDVTLELKKKTIETYPGENSDADIENLN